MASGRKRQSADILPTASGDIWKYDLASQTATRLTHWGYNGGPILSPDGSKIVYLSIASNFVAQFEAGTASQAGGSRAGEYLADGYRNRVLSQLIADQAGASHRRHPALAAQLVAG